MAVALSAVTKGSTITFPDAVGNTMSAILLEYNHYGKSEAAVLLPAVNIFNAARTTTSSSDPSQYNITGIYKDGLIDQFLMTSYKNLLAESIRKSTIPVSMYVPTTTYRTASINDTSATHKVSELAAGIAFTHSSVFYRDIFLPSIIETGYCTNTIYWTTNAEVELVRAMNQLLVADKNQTYNGKPFAYTTPFTNTTYPRSGSAVATIRGGVGGWYAEEPYLALTLFQGKNGFSGSAGSGMLNANTFNVRPIITLSGAIMVNSASGGAITESAAVESYRKINGKWYRTT